MVFVIDKIYNGVYVELLLCFSFSYYSDYKHSTPYIGVFSVKDPNLLIIDPSYVSDVLTRDLKHFLDNKFSKMVGKMFI